MKEEQLEEFKKELQPLLKEVLAPIQEENKILKQELQELKEAFAKSKQQNNFKKEDTKPQEATYIS